MHAIALGRGNWIHIGSEQAALVERAKLFPVQASDSWEPRLNNAIRI